MARLEWIGLGLMVVVVLVVSATWLIRGASGPGRRREGPSAARRPRSWAMPWVWVLVIALSATVTFLATPARRQGRAAEPRISTPMLVLLCAGLSMALVAGLVGVQVYRQYDPDASRALKLADAGDPAGAIADLKAAMDGRRPSSVRSNALGSLHFLREEWAEAHKAFVEAESLGADRALALSNQGAALLKLGRPVEAEAALAEACDLNPGQPIFATNLGFALLDLGRVDEARARLAAAERAARSLLLVPASARALMVEEIGRLRARIAAEAGPVDAPGG